MYLTTHATVGVLISQATDRPLWAFLFSLLLHFVLDFVPHGDESLGVWARKRVRNMMLIGFTDIGLLTLFLVYLYTTQDLPRVAIITAGVFGAVLPDLLSNIFPIIHHYTNWFFLVRFIHGILDKSRFRLLVRLHDWFHRVTHNTTNAHLSVKQGIVLQVFIVIITVTVIAQIL